MINFKDQCDVCKNFEILIGYKNECLCINCLLKILKERNVIDMNGIERIKILSAEITDKPLLKIVEYLLSREDMNAKYLNEEKSLSQMISYIRSEAKKQAKNGVAMIEDEVVYGWAIHYFDETNIDLGLDKKVDKIELEDDDSKTIENKPKKIISKKSKQDVIPEGQLQLELF